jgi:hypothetical protein
MKIKKEVYGIGGFDSTKPNNNIILKEEIDIKVDPVSRINFFLELSKNNLYKTLLNNKIKLTEQELILLEESHSFDIDSSIIKKLIIIFKISYPQMEEIFYSANINKL